MVENMINSVRIVLLILFSITIFTSLDYETLKNWDISSKITKIITISKFGIAIIIFYTLLCFIIK